MASQNDDRSRPITQALNLLRRAKRGRNIMGEDVGYVTLANQSFDRLVGLLTEANAASGTTDAKSAKKRATTIRQRKAAKKRAR